MKIQDKQLLQDVFQAYFDARRHKRNTYNQLQFEVNLERNLVKLAYEIENKTYEVGRSVCFIVDHPVKREIFAADFRDRVIHHLLFNYLNDFIDRRLIADCYSCRKGYGTSRGVERLEHHIRSVTDNFTKRAYVLKLDIRGYFMSMNRVHLYNKLEKMLTSRKNRKDKLLERKLYLLRKVVYADPVEGCFIKGSRNDWEGLPKAKSLFHTPRECGLPIGNLTSQLFSNVYLNDFDNWIKRDLKIKYYGRYVDDFYVLHPDKYFLLDVLQKIKEFLRDREGLMIHPNKIYLQELRKGVSFLGSFIKPHRRYMKSKVVRHVRAVMRYNDKKLSFETEPDTKTLVIYRSTLNSYLGYMKQFKTYGFREELWNDCKFHRKYFSINRKRTKVTLRERKYGYSNEDEQLSEPFLP